MNSDTTPTETASIDGHWVIVLDGGYPAAKYFPTLRDGDELPPVITIKIREHLTRAKNLGMVLQSGKVLDPSTFGRVFGEDVESTLRALWIRDVGDDRNRAFTSLEGRTNQNARTRGSNGSRHVLRNWDSRKFTKRRGKLMGNPSVSRTKTFPKPEFLLLVRSASPREFFRIFTRKRF